MVKCFHEVIMQISSAMVLFDNLLAMGWDEFFMLIQLFFITVSLLLLYWLWIHYMSASLYACFL